MGGAYLLSFWQLNNTGYPHNAGLVGASSAEIWGRQPQTNILRSKFAQLKRATTNARQSARKAHQLLAVDDSKDADQIAYVPAGAQSSAFLCFVKC
jgi:hypothetical protein